MLIMKHEHQQVLSVKHLILQHFKTGGQVFSNQSLWNFALMELSNEVWPKG